MQVLVDEQTIGVIDDEMEKGFMPAERMATAFNMLRANDLIWGYVVNNYMLGKDPFPFDLLYWNSDLDGDAGAGAFVLSGAVLCAQRAGAGAFSARDVPLTLADIRVPVYHVATREDHIAPAALGLSGAKQMARADLRRAVGGRGILPAWSIPGAGQSTSSGPIPT